METGQGGNPHGRRSDKAFAARVLKETKGGQELAQILRDITRQPPRMRERALACKLLLDRLFGAPPARLEIEHAKRPEDQ